MQTIFYKGGVAMVERMDKPDYQCTKCYKPWWKDELQPMMNGCQNCNAALRKITEQEPFKTN